MKLILYSNANKTHFHFKGFVLSCVFKERVSGTRKWPNNLGCACLTFVPCTECFKVRSDFFFTLRFFFFFNIIIDNHINHLFTLQSCWIITHILTAFFDNIFHTVCKKTGHLLLGLSGKVFTFDHLFFHRSDFSIIWQFLWLNGQNTVKIDAWALAKTVCAFIFVKE